MFSMMFQTIVQTLCRRTDIIHLTTRTGQTIDDISCMARRRCIENGFITMDKTMSMSLVKFDDERFRTILQRIFWTAQGTIATSRQVITGFWFTYTEETFLKCSWSSKSKRTGLHVEQMEIKLQEEFQQIGIFILRYNR